MSLRMVTLNLWGVEANLDSRIALAGRQLRPLSPDVLAVQEVRPSGSHTTAHQLAAVVDLPHVVYATASEFPAGHFAADDPAGEDGLAIVSRHPIAEHRAVELPEARVAERRILLSARVMAPGVDGGVWIHCTHLHWRLDDGVAREKQVVAIDDTIRAIDSTAPHILCGDFNSAPDSDEIRFLTGKHTLAGRRTHYQDAYAHIHPDEHGHTWCAQNPATRHLRSLDIDRRIDYVFVSTRRKDGCGTIRDCDVVLTERDDNGDCVSDHYGVMADIQVRSEQPGRPPSHP